MPELNRSRATRGRRRTRTRVFSRPVLEALDASGIIGVRAGAEHRYTAVWVLVIRGRVFARSWGDKPSGWYRAFLAEPRGSIRAGDRSVAVRAKRVRSQRLLDAMDLAYARKYNTPANRKWVRGFRSQGRRATSLEFVPA